MYMILSNKGIVTMTNENNTKSKRRLRPTHSLDVAVDVRDFICAEYAPVRLAISWVKVQSLDSIRKVHFLKRLH